MQALAETRDIPKSLSHMASSNCLCSWRCSPRVILNVLAAQPHRSGSSGLGAHTVSVASQQPVGDVVLPRILQLRPCRVCILACTRVPRESR